jgi:hypothetical protein
MEEAYGGREEREWFKGLPGGEGVDAPRFLLKDCWGPHMHRHSKTAIAEAGGRRGWESHGRSWGASAAVVSTRLMVMVSVRKKSDLSLRRAVETRVCLRGVFNSLRIQNSCLFQLLAQRGNTLTKIPNIETYSKSPATFSKSNTTLTRCTPQTSSGLSGGCIDRFIDSSNTS